MTAVATIVQTRKNTNIASSTMPAPVEIPVSRLGEPNLTIWPRSCRTSATRNAAISAPTTWATMYRTALAPEIFLIDSRPIVTAGLKCPPEIAPRVWMPMNSANPWASATNGMTMFGSGACAPASAPPYSVIAPMIEKTSRNVPTASAR